LVNEASAVYLFTPLHDNVVVFIARDAFGLRLGHELFDQPLGSTDALKLDSGGTISSSLDAVVAWWPPKPCPAAVSSPPTRRDRAATSASSTPTRAFSHF
jgi:hypothetical protein